MENFITAIFIGSLLMTHVFGFESCRPNNEDFGPQDLSLGKETVTRLQFYVQDLVYGQNRTALPVARSNITDSSPSLFGLLLILDNLITSGPEINSEEVGRIQGAVGLSDLNQPALAMLLNVVFTNGEYNGSTLSILGRNPLLEKVRELSIVGGTGVFRMARGYILTRTYAINEDKNGVYEYNVVVSHSDHTTMNEGMKICDVQP